MSASDVEGVDLGLIARFYAYQAPGIFLGVAPFVMLMAALISISRLKRHNEFMATVLTGRSYARVLRPVLAMTVVFIGVQVFVQEWAAPVCAEERDRLKSLIIEE